MSAEDDMAWPVGTTVIPADPPSPLTAEEAVEKALLYTFNWSDKQYAKMRGALTERAFIRALEQDGYTVATLDAARAADAGLRAAAQTVYDHHTGAVNHWNLDQRRCWEALRAALASPAPAGLDVERLRVAMTTFVRHRRPNMSANGFTEAMEAPSPEEVAAEYDRLTRAATRPAEEGKQ